jgi:hypothetical protein
VLFLLERLEPLPLSVLDEAAAQLIAKLRARYPNAALERATLGAVGAAHEGA